MHVPPIAPSWVPPPERSRLTHRLVSRAKRGRNRSGRVRRRSSRTRVAVLIVNWNSGRLLEHCLEHLDRQTRRPDRIIIVDNASADGSVDSIAIRWPKVVILRQPTNVGFAAANNVGAALARDCDAIALLNPDAFPEPGWLATLLDEMAEHPECGSFAGPLVSTTDPELIDGVGDVYHVGGLHWRQGHGTRQWREARKPAEIFSACSAAALYRASAFHEAGGFDEAYFCYSEDVDLGFRMQLLGYRCRYVPDAVVRHVGSAMCGTGSAFSTYHGHRNMVWTFVKNMPGALFWLYLPQHLLANAMTIAWFACHGRGRVIVQAKWDALFGLRRAWMQRRAFLAHRRADLWTLRRLMCRDLLAPYQIRLTRRRDRLAAERELPVTVHAPVQPSERIAAL